jgi:antitoxin component YwqK of YwqJK toxin-antitoxin module
LSSEDLYRDGRKLVRNTSFYRPKQKKDESFYLDARLEPDGMDNWWDAKPAPYLSSGKRVQNGQTRTWYENQQLQSAGQYKADKPVGRFYWWHKNGNRSSVGQFDEEGKRFGRWIWWHENGIKQVEGDYRDDEPVGVWKSWNEDGKLVKDKDYDEPDYLESPDDEDDEPAIEPSPVDPDVAGVDEPWTEGKLKPEASQLDDEDSSEAPAVDREGDLPNEGLESISPLFESESEEALPLPSAEKSALPKNPGSLDALRDQFETIDPQTRQSESQLNALPSLRARLSGFKPAVGAQQFTREKPRSSIPPSDLTTAPRLSRDLFETAVEPLRPATETEVGSGGVQLHAPQEKTTTSVEAFSLDLSE